MIISGSSNLPHGVSTDKGPGVVQPTGSRMKVRTDGDGGRLSRSYNKNKHPLPQLFGLAIDPSTQSSIKTQTGQPQLPPVNEYRLIDAKEKSVPLEMTANPASKGAVRGKLVDSVANSHAQYAIGIYAENRDLETRDQFKMMLGVDEYV